MTLPDRVIDKIDFSGECWTWTAYRNDDGYGIVRWQGRPEGVHRVAYRELVAPIPDGLELDHLCGNRACVHPDHLEPVSHAENVARGDRPNRSHCRNGHPWTPENIQVRRRGGADRRFRRDCVICTKARNRAAYERSMAFKAR